MYGRVGVNARVLVSTGRTDTDRGADSSIIAAGQASRRVHPLVLGSTFENPGT